jgi:hypothetical protein
VLGLAVSLLNHVFIASSIFGIAVLQLFYGMWRWIDIAKKFELAILAASVGLFAFLDWYLISPNRSIKIAPVDSYYDAGPGWHSNVFTVTNKSEDDLFEVEVRFRIQPKTSSALDFKLQIPRPSRKFIEAVGHSDTGDIMGYYCRTANDQPFVLASIYHLAPHETRNLVLTHTTQQEARITTDVTYASRDQRQIELAGKELHVPAHASTMPGCKDYSYSNSMGDVYTINGVPRAMILQPPN